MRYRLSTLLWTEFYGNDSDAARGNDEGEFLEVAFELILSKKKSS